MVLNNDILSVFHSCTLLFYHSFTIISLKNTRHYFIQAVLVLCHHNLFRGYLRKTKIIIWGNKKLAVFETATFDLRYKLHHYK